MVTPVHSVCITADDFGLTPAVNDAIRELAERGAINAVSVMVHQDATFQGLQQLARLDVALGLHLVLTGGRPLTRWPGGRLPNDYRSLFAQITLHRGLRRTLRDELAAQFDRYLALDGEVALTLVNSHEHMHLHPLIWPVVAELAEKHGVQWIRSARSQRPALSTDGLLALTSRLCWWLRPLPGCRTMSPERAIAARRHGGPALESALHAASRRKLLPGVLAELVVHPTRPSDPTACSGNARRSDYLWLSSGAARDALARHHLTAVRPPSADA